MILRAKGTVHWAFLWSTGFRASLLFWFGLLLAISILTMLTYLFYLSTEIYFSMRSGFEVRFDSIR